MCERKSAERAWRRQRRMIEAERAELWAWLQEQTIPSQPVRYTVAPMVYSEQADR